MKADTETQDVEQLLATVTEATRQSLLKEGADIEVEVEARTRRIIVSLIRERITCEECLLPEEIVQRSFRQALMVSGQGATYQIETRNWFAGPLESRLGTD